MFPYLHLTSLSFYFKAAVQSVTLGALVDIKQNCMCLAEEHCSRNYFKFNWKHFLSLYLHTMKLGALL